MVSRIVSALELKRRQMVLEQVRGRYLDIGCGMNRAVQDYRKGGGDGIGVDIYDFGGADLIVPDTARLDFPAGSFDTISFIACLNHIPNRGEVLREARRLLRPRGRVLITSLPPELSAVWHFLVRPWDEDQTERGMKEGEVWGMSTAQIKNLLADTGFDLIGHRRFVFGLNNLYISTAR
jgi:SAM-dependent methyltransferase